MAAGAAMSFAADGLTAGCLPALARGALSMQTVPKWRRKGALHLTTSAQAFGTSPARRPGKAMSMPQKI
jgi:hypothetical protein